MTRYRCVDDQKAAGFAVTRACEAMQVSTWANYVWHATGRQAAAERERRDAAG